MNTVTGKESQCSTYLLHNYIKRRDKIAATMIVGIPTVLINDVPVLHLSPLQEQAQISLLT